jgi:uncharacterized protein
MGGAGMKYHTLITGASTGIGKSLAEDFAAGGDNLVLVARSADKLEALATSLMDTYPIDVRVCCEDLGQAEGPERVFHFCSEEHLTIDRLINCAGFSMAGDYVRMAEGDLRQMAMVNMLAVSALTRYFVPSMIERRRGAVINIASLAAFQGVPGMAFYSATKSFVVTLTEALYDELRGSGVRVFAVCPGFIDNDSFYSRAGHDRERILVPIAPRKGVVRAVRRGLGNAAIAVIPTFFDSMMVFTQRLFSRKIVVRLAGFFAGAGDE